MAFALLYTALYALSGFFISSLLLLKERLIKRLWLGLVFGLLMLTWLPSLFAFFLRFGMAAQLCAAVLAFLLGGACLSS